MIFVPVSHLRQSYHIVETNPVYLVSTVDCLRIHCYATVQIFESLVPHYCPGDFASMVVSKYWSASSNARRFSTDTARLTVLYYDHWAALTVSSLFFCKLSNSAIRAAIMQVITGVIEQLTKAVAPRVVLSQTPLASL